MDYKFPKDLKYTDTHEWVKIEENIAIIGITDYAQYQLGDIVYIELPDKGQTFRKGDSATEIESVKAVGEIIIPLSGTIMDTNTNLIESPELINSSPFKEGWIIKIKISNKEEASDLLSIEDYIILVNEEDQ